MFLLDFRSEAGQKEVKGDANSEFSTALKIECIRRIVSLEENALAVLPTGFGKNVITTPCVRG